MAIVILFLLRVEIENLGSYQQIMRMYKQVRVEIGFTPIKSSAE